MSPIEVYSKSNGQILAEDLYRTLGARLSVSALSACPVEFAAAFVRTAASQSCGKCTPCRVGLAQLANLIDSVLDAKTNAKTLELIEELAESIYASADCAIGSEAGAFALRSIKGFKEDFKFHAEKHNCSVQTFAPVPCSAGCPAGIDIPGYLALVASGRFTDAVKLIRKDNPFVATCGLVCEYPCELYCRRGMVDDPINIRGIKRYAVDHQEEDYEPLKADATGKRIAIIGGGPSGLSAAYFLALMGHSPTVYEQRAKLGGMLRYGIPSYRFPREELEAEINWLVHAGIETKLGVTVGVDISLDDIRAQYDAVYLAIGAHADKKLGIEGEEAEGVLSAVELLRAMGDDEHPDLTGKVVAVLGGGNVAMDCARSALRLGARKVIIVYRRRHLDMPAQDLEIEAAIAEGCQLRELCSPLRIEAKNGKVCGLTVQPQIISTIKDGRAHSKNASSEPEMIACDTILVAIGQRIHSAPFEASGLATRRGALISDSTTAIDGQEGLFAGGDCVSEPATVIQAVAAGKAAAFSIDEYLGFKHEIESDVTVPKALFKSRMHCARSNTTEVFTSDLAGDYTQVEKGLLPEEAMQEASRCLRCDHFGLGAFRERRALKW